LIFVTVGTHHQPFERLLDALSELPGEELVVQYGPGAPPAGVRRAVAYLPFDEMLACYSEAEKVITHAGVGSILCARRAGHLPLVVPRRHDLGEHVDDHQAELIRVLEQRGSVVAVWETADLAGSLASSPPRSEAVAETEPALCPSVRAALQGAGAAPSAT
jgi:UDP-N-acetylglucosamine transferase subunit ALG13